MEPTPSQQTTPPEQPTATPPISSRGTSAADESPIKGRAIVKQMFYHQEPRRDATVVQSNAITWLNSDEQPVERVKKVGECWEVIDTQWLPPGGVGFLILTNEPAKFARNPTPEERAEAEGRVIEVGLYVEPTPSRNRDMHSPARVESGTVPFAFTPPGGPAIILCPLNLSQYRVRCRSGVARVTFRLYAS